MKSYDILHRLQFFFHHYNLNVNRNKFFLIADKKKSFGAKHAAS